MSKHLKKALSWAKTIAFMCLIGMFAYGVLKAPFWIAWFGITLLSFSLVGVCFAFYEQYKNNALLSAENEDLKHSLQSKK